MLNSLMTIINLPILKLKFYGNVSSILVSQVSAYVHFLNFGNLKMRCLPIESIYQTISDVSKLVFIFVT